MPDLHEFDITRIHTDIAQVEELIIRTEYLVQEEQDAGMKLLLQDQLVAYRQELATLNALLARTPTTGASTSFPRHVQTTSP